MDSKTSIVLSLRENYIPPQIDTVTLNTESILLNDSKTGDGGGNNPDPGGWN